MATVWLILGDLRHGDELVLVGVSRLVEQLDHDMGAATLIS
jgi:hypothetical protein